MSKISGLVKKIGKPLGEYFLGIETRRFLRNQETLLKENFHAENQGKYNAIINHISIKKSELNLFDISIGLIEALLGLGTLTSRFFSSSAPEDNWRIVFGAGTLAYFEIFRLYINYLFREERKKITQEVDAYMKTLKTPVSKLDYV